MSKPLPTQALAELFCGRQALAIACGVTSTLVRKWEVRETGLRPAGHIPPMYNAAILAAARAAGVSHKKVAEHLDQHACPLCGRKMPPGVKIDAERARRLSRGVA